MADFVVDKEIVVLDISAVCRVCLKSNGTVSIFSEDELENDLTLRQRIMSFACVELVKDDGLPSQVCKICVGRINSAFQLKAQCEYTDMFLRQHLSSEKITNKEELIGDGKIVQEIDEVGELREIDSDEEVTVGIVNNLVDTEDIEKMVKTEPCRLSNTALSIDNNILADSKNSGNIVKELKTIASSAENIFVNASSINIKPSVTSGTVESIVVSDRIGTGNDIIMQADLPVIVVDINDPNYQFVRHVKAGDVSPNHTKQTKSNGVRKRKVMQCNICNKWHGSERYLKKHLSREHEPSGEYSCGECGRMFPQEMLLEFHEQVHIAKRPYKCSLCGKCFVDSHGLRSHKRTHKFKRNKHLCIHCGKFFATPKNHVCPVLHKIREKKHECVSCGKFFLTQATLATHMKRHRSPGFSCKICNSTYFGKSGLERHMYQHLGVRPFACTVPGCKWSFLSQGELNRHTRYHNQEKRFKCDQCELSFVESGPLIKHKRKHNEEQLYVCELCSESFEDTSKLKRHIDTHCTD